MSKVYEQKHLSLCVCECSVYGWMDVYANIIQWTERMRGYARTQHKIFAYYLEYNFVTLMHSNRTYKHTLREQNTCYRQMIRKRFKRSIL